MAGLGLNHMHNFTLHLVQMFSGAKVESRKFEVLEAIGSISNYQ